MVDVLVNIADVVGVVADEVGIDPRLAEAAIERLFRVRVAVLLGMRFAGFQSRSKLHAAPMRRMVGMCSIVQVCETTLRQRSVPGRGLIS